MNSLRCRECVLVTAILIAFFFFQPQLEAQVVHRGDFHAIPNAPYGSERYEKTIQVGPKQSFPATIDITPKGNGWLNIANLRLRIFKEHNDGQVFDPPLLHVEFVDITNDGYKDLVIFGIIRYTGEKETDPQTTEPVAAIYIFDPKAGRFALRFSCGPRLDGDITEGSPTTRAFAGP